MGLVASGPWAAEGDAAPDAILPASEPSNAPDGMAGEGAEAHGMSSTTSAVEYNGDSFNDDQAHPSAKAQVESRNKFEKQPIGAAAARRQRKRYGDLMKGNHPGSRLKAESDARSAMRHLRALWHIQHPDEPLPAELQVKENVAGLPLSEKIRRGIVAISSNGASSTSDYDRYDMYNTNDILYGSAHQQGNIGINVQVNTSMCDETIWACPGPCERAQDEWLGEPTMYRSDACYSSDQAAIEWWHEPWRHDQRTTWHGHEPDPIAQSRVQNAFRAFGV